ncbi:FAD binding domain-containing protein [Obelidium mucronatum]|nr:FAD binding domain-containing protein [Obelidium mucronatum]
MVRYRKYSDLQNESPQKLKKKKKKQLNKQIEHPMTESSGFDVSDLVIVGVVTIATGLFLWFRSSGAKVDSKKGTSVPASRDETSHAREGTASGRLSKKTITSTLATLQTEHKLLLFYGSQTGTAEDLATRTANEVYANFGIESAVCDLEDFEMGDLLTYSANQDADSKVVIGFFLATYGEGEPTDNAADFYEWFLDGRGKGDDDDIEDIGDEMALEKQGEGIHYIMFGLGNKTYEHYNSMGRRVARRLDSIGAKRVGTLGEGDDDGSMEDDFLAWKPKVLEALSAFYGVKDMGGKANRGIAHVPLFNISFESTLADKGVFHGELSGDHKPRRFKDGPGGEDKRKYVEVSAKKRILYDAKNPLFSRIVSSRNLFSETFDETKISPTDIVPTPSPKYYTPSAQSVKIQRHCIHMEFDLSNTGLRYESGDHVGIYGTNSVAHVNALAEVLGLTDEQLDGVVKLKANAANRLSAMAKMPFPNPCTVRTALTHYLAISAPVKQHQLELIAKYTSDVAEKEAIYALVDDRALYVEKVEASQKNLAEILRDFPNVKLPLQVILGELLGPIVVRYYSISSSSKKEPQTVSITAVAVRYVLPQKSLLNSSAPSRISYKEGLVTSYINRLHEGNSGLPESPELGADSAYPRPDLSTHVPIFIRTSSFRLPRDPAAPIIMIGPGTGVAPFRAFLHERVHVAVSGPKKPVGTTLLFYGCRHPDQDHLYKEEISTLLNTVEGLRNSSDEAEKAKAFDLRVMNAFSRVPGQQKVYVQDIVSKMGKEVYDILDKQRGYLYVCGDAKNMAADVNTLLHKLSSEWGGKSEEEAKKWVKTLKTTGKYHEDVW